MGEQTDIRMKIIETASRLFSEAGFDATSTELIAKESGISKGDLFHYFKTKNELIRAVAMKSLPLDVFEDVLVKQYSTAEDLLTDFGLSFLKRYADRTERLLFLMTFSVRERYPDVKEALYNSCEGYVNRLFAKVEKLARVTVPLHARRAFIGALLCYIVWWDPDIEMVSYVRQLVKDLLRLYSS